MKKYYLLFFVILLLFGTLFARKFSYFPTTHFDVYYDMAAEEQVVQLVEQGNEIYELLSAFYGVELDEKLRVYLLDDVDFSNAYADFFSNAVVIYINRGSVDYYDNSYEWWVPFVFSHELTHILIANKKDWLKDFLNVFGKPVSMLFDTAFTPSFFHEGVAIYSESFFSEKGRLKDDRYLSYISAEIQDSGFKGFSLAGSMNSPQFTPTGYNYLYGSFFVDYIEAVYGKEAVAEMVNHYGEKYRFNFRKMVEAISGVHFGQFIHDWRVWLQEKTAFVTDVDEIFKAENITKSGYYSGINCGTDDYLYYFVQKAGEQTSLKRYNGLETESDVVSFPVDFDMSSAGTGAFIYANSNGLEKYDLALYVGNEKTGLRKIKEIKRPRAVSWQTDDCVLYTYLENGGTGLASLNLVNGERTDYLHPSADYYINNISVTASVCYMSISFNGNSDVYKLDLNNGVLTQITQTVQNEIDVFVHDHMLYFSSNAESYETDKLSPYDIYSLDLSSGQILKLTASSWGAYNPVVYHDELYYRGYSGSGFDLYKVILPSNKEREIFLPEEKLLFQKDLCIQENQAVSNVVMNWNSEKILLPSPRFGIPALIPFDNNLYGVAGIAGWDDLKEWIWYGYYIGSMDFRKWDYTFMHRGMPDFTLTWNGDWDYEELKASLKFPFYLRESEKFILLRPGVDFGTFHTSQNLDLRMISDLSLYFSSHYIGYPDNPVRVPEFYQMIQLGTSGYYASNGIGLALPFSTTGLLKQKTYNGSTRLSAEVWFPFSHFTSLGTSEGKFKLSSLTLHLGENLDIKDNLQLNPSTVLGVWIDLGVQYWLDLKLIVDFEFDFNKITPVISLQNSIL